MKRKFRRSAVGSSKCVDHMEVHPFVMVFWDRHVRKESDVSNVRKLYDLSVYRVWHANQNTNATTSQWVVLVIGASE